MRFINETRVREELLKRADSGPNEMRRRVWADCSEEPKLYSRVSAEVLREIDDRVGLICAEIVSRNPAGRIGVTIN